MQKENGFIILDDLKVSLTIPRDMGGEILKFYKGEELFFKSCNEAQAMSSLFGAEVCRELGIPVVSFGLAKYKGIIGTVATSFNPKHEKVVFLNQILNKYYKEVVEKKKHKSYITKAYDLYNLDDLSLALLYCYHDEKIVRYLMQKLYVFFFLQFILGDFDMHFENLAISNGDFVPLFDFDGCFKLDYYSNYRTISLEKTGHDLEKRRKPIEVLEEMIPLYGNLLKNMLDKLSSKEEILAKIETQLGVSIHPNLTRHIKYDEYLDELRECLKEKQNRFCPK